MPDPQQSATPATTPKWAVQAPDGKVIQFPDEFTDADVTREMTKMYPARPNYEEEAAANRPIAPITPLQNLGSNSPLGMLAQGQEAEVQGNEQIARQYMKQGPMEVYRGAQEVAGRAPGQKQSKISSGLNRIISGAGVTAMPAMINALPFAAVSAPAATATGLVGGVASQQTGQRGGAALGLNPDQAQLAGNVTGLLGGYLGSEAPSFLRQRGSQIAKSIANQFIDRETPAASAAASAQAPSMPNQTATNQQPAIQGGAVGGSAGSTAPGAPVGRIARTLGITDPPPNQLLTKAIKPLASNTGWDSAIAKAGSDMKAAEADLGHPITGVDDALSAVNIAKKVIWKQYAAKLAEAQQKFPNAPTLTAIDGNEIADAMMVSIDKRTALQNPNLVKNIQNIADTYRRPLALDEAEDFLQSTNNDLHSYYAKNKVGRQIAERDPATGYMVAEGDQLRDSLYSTLDNLTGPGAADLKSRYGALSNVENELLRRKNVAARQQPESLAEQLTMARSFGKIALGTLRGSPGSVLEGTQSLAAAKWLKARGTTDAMISRAFEALGRSPAPAASVAAAPKIPPFLAGVGLTTAAPQSGLPWNKK
jgi:hypothetical protein